jgi:hypothetical protein
MQRLFVALVIGAFSLGTAAQPDVGSPSKSTSHDLSAIGKTFDNYSKDFRAMEQPLGHGDELLALESLDQVATTAEDRVSAGSLK